METEYYASVTTGAICTSQEASEPHKLADLGRTVEQTHGDSNDSCRACIKGASVLRLGELTTPR